MARVFTIVQPIVAAPGFYDVRPPVGQDWEITDIVSDAIVGVALNGVPDVQAGIFNDLAALPALMRNSSAAAAAVRGWATPSKWHVNNTNYLRVLNPEVAPHVITISAILGKNTGNIINSGVISGTAFVGAGNFIDIVPPLGQDWVITDVGSSIWLGAGAAGQPDITIELVSGLPGFGNAAILSQATDARGWNRQMEIYINNGNFLRLTNTGAAATVGWSGAIARRYSPINPSQVISRVLVLGAGGNVDIQPPVGEEWVITDIGCSLFFGGAPPADLPNVLVSLTDGALFSIAQQRTENKGWLDGMAYYLTNTNYMNLFDSGGAGCNVCVSGHRWLA